MRPITVLVVDGTRSSRAALKEALAREPDLVVVGEAEDGVSALRAARELKPDVVVLDALLPGSDGLAAAAAIRRDVGAQVVVVSTEQSPEYFRRAMQAGACDYLPKPPRPAELVAAVRAAAGRAGLPAAAQDRRGRVVTVFSGKGGVGKTMVAVNLAVGLSLCRGGRAALVDLDLEHGGVEGALQLRPRASLADLVRLEDPPDPDRAELALTPVPGYPLAVLAAPPSPHLAAEVEGEPGRADRVGQVLAALAEGFPWVVVDTAPSFRDSTLAALDRSDLVLLLTTPDVPSVMAAARCLDLLCGRLGFPRERVRVVLNRRDPVCQLKAADVADALGMPVAWELPHDARAAVSSVNVGQPLCGRRVRSPLAGALGRMAAAVAETLSPAGAGAPAPAARDARDGR